VNKVQKKLLIFSLLVACLTFLLPTEATGDSEGSLQASVPDWFHDEKLGGINHHLSRSHMREDLYRYLFASCFAKVHGRSPRMRDLALCAIHMTGTRPESPKSLVLLILTQPDATLRMRAD
jgi:hypothetical protein